LSNKKNETFLFAPFLALSNPVATSSFVYLSSCVFLHSFFNASAYVGLVFLTSFDPSIFPTLQTYQGLLNAIIFIYDKVHILRVGTDWSISFSESLATSIRNPASIPGVVIIFEDQEMHPNNSELNLHQHKIIMQSWLMTKRIRGSNDSAMIDSANSGVMSKVNSAIEDDVPSINSAWERESNPVSEKIF